MIAERPGVTKRRVALVPLDERPVNTGLVQDVAAVAGAECTLPGADLLPCFRQMGDVAGIAGWLRQQASEADALVVSIDTLVYGGLIAARTSDDTIEAAVGRLSLLRQIAAAQPGLPILGCSLITRASDSYSATEEPAYWARFGRDLHRLGADAHQAWLAGQTLPDQPIPSDIRGDFVRRRLRNHVVNLAVLRLSWDHVLSYLALTADDTARYAAGSAEQVWLDYWRVLAGPDLPVVSYQGADETGAVLMARALLAGTGAPPRVHVVTAAASSLELIPPYENRPLRVTIEQQLAAAGAQPAGAEDAELVLVVHGPDPGRGDHFSLTEPTANQAAVAATADLVGQALAGPVPVALADVRFTNGGDADLAGALAQRGLLGRLAAYGGWNTAGNALGSTIAMGLAGVAGRRRGTLSRTAQAVALRRRLLDDVAWQAVVRRRLMADADIFAGSISPVADDVLARASVKARQALAAALADWGLASGYEVSQVTFPWHRSFEIDISLKVA